MGIKLQFEYQEEIESLRAQLKAAKDELEQVTHARDVLHDSYINHIKQLATVTHQRDIAEAALKKIAENKNQSMNLMTLPPISQRAYWAQEALDAIQQMNEAKKEEV